MRLTHPDRVVYPDVGITKRQVAEYVAAVAPWMLPHVADRPLSLVRCPGWSGRAVLLSKAAASRSAPVGEGDQDSVQGRHDRRRLHRGRRGALGAGAIRRARRSMRGSRGPTTSSGPIESIFDLDPGPNVEWSRVVDTALLRARLLETPEADELRQDDRRQRIAHRGADRARSLVGRGQGFLSRECPT